jgi:hypothetical protein
MYVCPCPNALYSYTQQEEKHEKTFLSMGKYKERRAGGAGGRGGGNNGMEKGNAPIGMQYAHAVIIITLHGVGQNRNLMHGPCSQPSRENCIHKITTNECVKCLQLSLTGSINRAPLDKILNVIRPLIQ